MAAVPTPAKEAVLAGWQQVLPPAAAFTGITAALLRGWWTPVLPPVVPVFVGLPHVQPRPRRPGLVVHRQVRTTHVEILGGLRVADAADVLLSAARDLSLLDLIVLVDAALHRGDCDLVGLAGVARDQCRGAPLLRRALRLADGRSESAWETVLRLLLVSCRVPVDVQYDVHDRAGRFVARADFRVTGTRRLLEYDGGGHREPGQHARDLGRERRLQHEGWQRFGYTSAVVLHNARSVLLDADAALGRPHRPERIRAWHRLLASSTFSPAGRARLGARWAAAAGQGEFGSATSGSGGGSAT